MTIRQNKALEPPRKGARKAQSKHREQVTTYHAKGARKAGLVVLGMHRSGTSALAGSLRLCGAWVGQENDLTGSNIENPKGFWERRDMRAVCDELLRAAGADWCRVADFDTSAIPHVTLTEQRRAFWQIVTELDRYGTWAVKEPRLCLLFPVLRPLIANPVCIHIYRNPLEVARSLRTRNGFSVAEGLALWELYNISAFRASEGLPRLLVSYEALASRPEETLNTIVGELADLGVDHLHEPAREAIQDFIEPDLRRQRAKSTETSDFLLPSQRQLWSQLKSRNFFHPKPDQVINHVAREYLRDLDARWLSQQTQRQSTKEYLAKLQAQKAQTDKLVSQLQAQKAQTGKLVRQLQAQKACTGELKSKFQAQKARASELKIRLGKRNETIGRLKNSTSWRITAPLREVSLGQKWLLRNARRTLKALWSAKR